MSVARFSTLEQNCSALSNSSAKIAVSLFSRVKEDGRGGSCPLDRLKCHTGF
jgi:hypothetical protein